MRNIKEVKHAPWKGRLEILLFGLFNKAACERQIIGILEDGIRVAIPKALHTRNYEPMNNTNLSIIEISFSPFHLRISLNKSPFAPIFFWSTKIFSLLLVVFVLEEEKKRSFLKLLQQHSSLRSIERFFIFFCFSRGSFSFFKHKRILRKTLYFFTSSSPLPFVSSYAWKDYLLLSFLSDDWRRSIPRRYIAAKDF